MISILNSLIIICLLMLFSTFILYDLLNSKSNSKLTIIFIFFILVYFFIFGLFTFIYLLLLPCFNFLLLLFHLNDFNNLISDISPILETTIKEDISPILETTIKEDLIKDVFIIDEGNGAIVTLIYQDPYGIKVLKFTDVTFIFKKPNLLNDPLNALNLIKHTDVNFILKNPNTVNGSEITINYKDPSFFSSTTKVILITLGIIIWVWSI